MNRRFLLPIAAAGAAITLGFSGCGRNAAATEAPPFRAEGDTLVFRDLDSQLAAVSVAPLSRATDDHVEVTGRLVWDEDLTGRVFSPVAGRVSGIMADVGRPVGRGQLLATLSSPDFGQAQADAARALTDLRAANRTFDRVSEVFAHGGAARKDRDQAEADLERARAEAERTARRLQSWGGTAAGRVDQEFRLGSPVAGVVVERNLNPGQEVRPDAAAPLFVISNPHRLWVLLDVTEADLANLEPGAALVIHTAAFPERSFDGVLETLGAGLDPATRTVKARGRVANPDGRLRAEMYVTLQAQRRPGARRIVAPARAVMQDDGQRFVFVELAPGRFGRVQVQVGPEREGVVPVLAGLPDDARVVVEGELLLEAAWSEVHRK